LKTAQTSSFQPFLLTALVLVRAVSSLFGNVVIEERSLILTHSVDMVAEAENKDFIRNKMSWPPILNLLPEGAKVKKGERVILFDSQELKDDIRTRTQGLEIADLELEKKILDLERESQSIKDNIELKEAEIEVLNARLRRLKSFPHESDVDLARGSVKVSRLQYEEKRDEVSRAELRLSKGLISSSALEDLRSDLRVLQHRLHASESILSYVSTPMSKLSIELIRLQQKRLQVELEKFRDELENQEEVSELERQSAKRQRNRSKKRLDEKKEELDHIELYAPRDGFLHYEASFVTSLKSGKKPRKNSTIMAVPHLDTIVFKGNLPGHLGSQFKVGDRAHILIPHLSSTAFSGNISSLSASPKDLMDQSSSWEDQGKKSGIKFFPFTVRPDQKISNLKPGLNARVVLHATQPIKGAMAPAHYLEYRGDKIYGALDGQITPLEGRFVDSWFLLDDSKLIGRSIKLKGAWIDHAKPCSSDGKKYTLTGELKPQNAVDVHIPIFQSWWSRDLELQWLVEEGLQVSEGDHLLTVDSSRARESFKDLEDEVERARLSMESTAKEHNLKSKKGAFELKMKKLDLHIAEVRLKQLLETKEDSNLIRARESSAIAMIELERATREQERIKNQPEFNSERSILEAGRELKLRSLALEQSLIRLEKARNPVTQAQIAKAKSDLSKSRFRMTQQEGRLQQQKRNALRSNTWKKRRFDRNLEDLERRKEDFENYKVMAPSNGLIQYHNIWGDGKMIPVQEGARVWPNSKVLRLIDNDRVYVETDVSERHTHKVKVGMEVSIDIPAMDAFHLKGILTHIDEVYKPARRPDTESPGLYGTQEGPGESSFRVRIEVEEKSMKFKSGAVAKVTFPFEGK